MRIEALITNSRISRRTFIKSLAGSAGAVILAGCKEGESGGSVTPAPAGTPVLREPQIAPIKPNPNQQPLTCQTATGMDYIKLAEAGQCPCPKNYPVFTAPSGVCADPKK